MGRRVDIELTTQELRRFARALSARGESVLSAAGGLAEARADALVRHSVRSVQDAADGLDAAQLRVQLFSAAIHHNRALLRREKFESGAAPARQRAFADAAGPAVPHAAGAQTAVAALAQLPEEAREVLLLVSLSQFSYAQAGQALGIPLSETFDRLTAARAAFGVALEQADDTAVGAFAARPQTVYPLGRRPAAQHLRLVK